MVPQPYLRRGLQGRARLACSEETDEEEREGDADRDGEAVPKVVGVGEVEVAQRAGRVDALYGGGGDAGR